MNNIQIGICTIIHGQKHARRQKCNRCGVIRDSHYTRKRVSWTTEAKAVTGYDNALARPKMKLFYSPEKALSEGEAMQKSRVAFYLDRV